MTGMAVLLLVRPIVRHRDRFAQSDERGDGGARMQNIQTERERGSNAGFHLSWWNEDALRVLADRLDLLTEAIEAVPFSFDTIIYWMGRCAPKLIGNRYVRAHWV
jgi:hypothetical protein